MIYSLGIPHGEKGYAALPGREADFKASLNKAIDYAVAVSCPRYATLACFQLLANENPASLEGGCGFQTMSCGI